MTPVQMTQVLLAQARYGVRKHAVAELLLVPFLPIVLKILPFLIQLILELLIAKHREQAIAHGHSDVVEMLDTSGPVFFLPETRAALNMAPEEG